MVKIQAVKLLNLAVLKRHTDFNLSTLEKTVPVLKQIVQGKNQSDFVNVCQIYL